MLPEKVCIHCLAYMIDDKLEGWIKCIACGFMKKKEKSMITAKEILMGRIKLEELTPELQGNLEVLLERLNKFRKEYGSPMIVSSGYRSPEDNKKENGSPKSAHMTLQACDFRDNDGKLFEFIKADPSILDKCDLWMEDAQWCPNWIHLSIRPASKRIFIPYSDGRPPLAPNRKIT